jgi:hypothetical protein
MTGPGATTIRAVLVLALSLPALSGVACVSLHGPDEIKTDLSREVGVKLDREFTISVNRGGMWLARKGLKWSGEDEISLEGVHHVDVGIYNVEGLRKGFEAPRAIHPDLFDGWESLVRVQEEGEHVLVLTREKKESIKGLLVVVAESDEWVIVRVKGNLDDVLEMALAEAFDEIQRPDLYEKTVEEREREREETPEEDPNRESVPLKVKVQS